jgi:hypothetical protein
MFDCVLFFNELDLLEMRMNILDDVVERFVIVESTTTHSGIPKPLHFVENDYRFQKFWPKITHIIYEGILKEDAHLHATPINWNNENGQRNKALQVLQQHRPSDDLMMFCDVDEIPKPEKVLEGIEIAKKTGSPVSLSITQCMYWLNYAMIKGNGFRGPFICNPYTYEDFHFSKFNVVVNTPSGLRWHMLATGLEKDFPTVEDSGWHFSTIGGFDKIKIKLESFAHHDQFDNEYHKSIDYIVKRMIRGEHLYTQEYYGNAKLEIQDLSFLPKYVQDNIGKYETYII